MKGTDMQISYRQLVVHQDNTARSAVRLKAASDLALQHGAALCGVYAATAGYIGMPYTPGLGDAALADLLAQDDKQRAQAQVAFKAAMTGAAGVSWCEVTEMPVIGAFVQQALYADLLVLGQHDPMERLSRDIPADFAQSVIAGSGKPALVIPFTGDLPERMDNVVIGWKETPEAARAVAAAMPLLQRARNVHVLSWSSDTLRACTGDTLDLEKYLRLHGVEAQWHRYGAEPDHLGELMLSRSFDLDGHLLVMGCYGHSRAREWVMGGASRTVLQSMTLPVLIAH